LTDGLQGETKNDPTRCPDEVYPPPGPTPPTMTRHKRKKIHTGSVVAQDNQDRGSAARNPSEPASERGCQSRNEEEISLGNSIKILNLNIEGLSMAKCEYLEKLLMNHDIDVLLLQETHVGADAPPSRYTVQGYHLIARVNHNQYGTMIMARKPEIVEVVTSEIKENDVHESVIRIGNLTIGNLYKPPQSEWADTLREYQHPSAVIGDFNSHHHDWGYQSCNNAGEEVSQWASQTNMQLIYSPNDRRTFFSARWRREYNPDLIFVTRDENQRPLPTYRQVLSDFPNSQHRPILITIGHRIPLSQSLPLPRWNFRKARWNDFSKYIDEICRRIPATGENMTRFNKLLLTGAARHIPRGFRRRYVPCWSQESEELLEEYERTQSPEVADELLSSLEKGRQERWTELTESLDFRHSSRKAWNLLKKLDPDKKAQPKTKPTITVDEIAAEIKNRSKRNPNHIFEKRIRRELRENLNRSPITSPLSSNVSDNETKLAIKHVKNGNGIYPDMLTHLGPGAVTWLSNAFSDIIKKGKLPTNWNQAKIIAILKPGKKADNPGNYRQIALLCCGFKLLERIILTRLLPVLDPHIPMDQAGFRTQRDTTEQVLALTSYIESGFERKLKTGAILVDLSAAYDTVWHTGLMYKLSKLVKCQTTLKLLGKMTGKRSYHVCVGGQTSRTRTIANGVPQGSVLAPTLFNIYISDLPHTESHKFGPMF